jgi:hypothetical protein
MKIIHAFMCCGINMISFPIEELYLKRASRSMKCGEFVPVLNQAPHYEHVCRGRGMAPHIPTLGIMWR